MSVKWNGAAIEAKLRQAVMQAVAQGTEDVRNEAIELIRSSPASGEVYHRRGVTHKASAPGEPPATDTGHLVNSITTKYNPSELSGQVIVGAGYGPYLEFGTATMEPRPFLRPALEKASPKFASGLSAAIQKVTKA